MVSLQEIAAGSIDVEAWKQTERIMLAQKLIPVPVSVEKALRACLKSGNRSENAGE